MNDIDAIISRLAGLPAEQQAAFRENVMASTSHMKWVPNPGPQTMAYESKADILLYGGEPGGGKSQLGLGLAYNEHKRSLIMRRQYGDLDGLIGDILKIHGSKDGFNGSPPPKLKIGEGRIIDFHAAHRVGDEQGLMGKAHDFIMFDEGTQFAEQQVRFIMGWLRTEVPGQRCRVVIATNPPMSAEGLWIIEMFAPWIDPRFPKPANPGELRWFVNDEHGKDRWVDGPEPVFVGDRMVHPMSRTYIPASVRDNPNYMATGYQKTLDNMSEIHRSILLGGFKTSFRDQDRQVIPTKWVQLAQERWTPRPPSGIPMCAIGVDCSGGGHDPMVLAPRYDGWFAPFVEVEGKDIPMETAGRFCAGMVLTHRQDGALVVVDMGGGYGGPLYEHLYANEIDVQAYRGAEKTTRRSVDGKMHFYNTRSAALWQFREALDPGQPSGSPIALPPGNQIVADLTAPTFEVTPNGIKVEPKEDVCDRLGRSTNHGDAAMMSWFYGAKECNSAMEWADAREMNRKYHQPKVVGSRREPLSARGMRR